MRIFDYLDDVVAWAPAKVNLFLEVLGKRPDGYHELQTLMVAVRWFDTLVFQPSQDDDVTLACTRPDLGTGPDNLVVRAARLLQEHTGHRRGAKIRLVKRIPMAAGLAGGSTDAAAALLGLNRLWRLGLSMDELSVLAGRLGSDVAFFLHTPAAWCTGRGEIVTPIEMKRPLDLVLVCPTFPMPTGPVFGRLNVPDKPVDADRFLEAFRQGDPVELGPRLFNRLQTPAEAIDHRIGEYLERIRRENRCGTLMSGSGSTLFALSRSTEDAEALAARLREVFMPAEASVHAVRSYP